MIQVKWNLRTMQFLFLFIALRIVTSNAVTSAVSLSGVQQLAFQDLSLLLLGIPTMINDLLTKISNIPVVSVPPDSTHFSEANVLQKQTAEPSIFSSGNVGHPLRVTIPNIENPVERILISWIKQHPGERVQFCDNVLFRVLSEGEIQIDALLQPLGLVCVIADLLSAGHLGNILQDGILGNEILGEKSVLLRGSSRLLHQQERVLADTSKTRREVLETTLSDKLIMKGLNTDENSDISITENKATEEESTENTSIETPVWRDLDSSALQETKDFAVTKDELLYALASADRDCLIRESVPDAVYDSLTKVTAYLNEVISELSNDDAETNVRQSSDQRKNVERVMSYTTAAAIPKIYFDNLYASDPTGAPNGSRSTTVETLLANGGNPTEAKKVVPEALLNRISRLVNVNHSLQEFISKNSIQLLPEEEETLREFVHTNQYDLHQPFAHWKIRRLFDTLQKKSGDDAQLSHMASFLTTVEQEYKPERESVVEEDNVTVLKSSSITSTKELDHHSEQRKDGIRYTQPDIDQDPYNNDIKKILDDFKFIEIISDEIGAKATASKSAEFDREILQAQLTRLIIPEAMLRLINMTSDRGLEVVEPFLKAFSKLLTVMWKIGGPIADRIHDSAIELFFEEIIRLSLTPLDNILPQFLPSASNDLYPVAITDDNISVLKVNLPIDFAGTDSSGEYNPGHQFYISYEVDKKSKCITRMFNSIIAQRKKNSK